MAHRLTYRLAHRFSVASPRPTVTPQRHPRFRQLAATLVGTLVGTVAIALSLGATPAMAGDPFRSRNPHAISDRTEAAFNELFVEGNYSRAAELLQNPDPNEPLAFAMKASLAYVAQDYAQMGQNATATREAAERLMATDPLRGHLYVAGGHFLEGAYIATTQGIVASTPTLLGKLQLVFDSLQEAEKIDPNDPELNLLKGYMDLMLAVYLPFSDPNQAIARLQTYAAPTYLAQRGIAVGYRDLEQYDPALEAVDQALAETPDNPDLLYLKAQILRLQGKLPESLTFFQQALAFRAQLPRRMVIQIAYEQCRTDQQLNSTRVDCRQVSRQ